MVDFRLHVLFRSAVFILLLALATISQSSCKNRTEVLGFPKSFADLAEKVRPAVVNISTTSTVTVPGNPFKQFFGPNEQGPFGDFFKHYFQRGP